MDELEDLAAEMNRLKVFHDNTMRTMRATFGDDDAAFRRCMRVLEGAMADNGASVDLRAALDQALDERDRARRGIVRLKKAGEFYAVAIVEGTA